MINNNRLWTIGAVTVMIILLLAGWFLGAQPFLTAAAAADEERAGIDAQNAAQQAEIQRLTEENNNLPAVQDEYNALLASIPTSANSAAFIQGLDGLAAASGVQVIGITVSESVAYTVPASAAAAADAAAAAETAEGSAPAPTPTEAPVVVPTGSVAATSPLITPSNFVGIRVGVDLKGGYQQVLSFVDGLQTGARLVLVTGFTSDVNADDPSVVTAHIDGMIYVIKKNG